MIPVKTYYGNSIIDADSLPRIRSSGQFNPPGLYPLDESKNWKNINFKSPSVTQYINCSAISQDRIRDYAIRPLDDSAYFNQQAFRSKGNPLLQLFFNEINIDFIKEKVRDEILKLRNQPINTNIDNNALQNLMQETFTLAYQGKMPQLFPNKPESEICNLKNLIADLNKQVINRYVKHAISSIDMYKYYINDVTTLPVPLERPTFTSITGSNVTSQQVGLGDVDQFNSDIREWNNRFSRFSNPIKY